MKEIFYYIDYFIYILMFISVGYLFFFSLQSLRKKKKQYSSVDRKSRYVVLFPAYKEDKVIESSVSSFLEQDYPTQLYDVVVLSDKMQPDTNQRLKQLPIQLIELNFENSTKAKSLDFAMNTLDPEKYDAVIILDADNTVNTDFLTKMNDVYASGIKVAQAHRVAKNQETDIAVLDAMSEEINNSIFRRGFDRAGFSCTLSGSGMMFDYSWFKENVSCLSSSGEDKELEAILLKQRIHIEYVEDVYVYDEKTKKTDAFYQQRRRWLAAQYGTLFNSLKDIPQAVSQGNMDYCNKLIQWMMFPRIILIGLIFSITIIISFIDWSISIKWWGLLLLLLISLSLAIPRSMVNRQLFKALWRIPSLFFLMVLNLFRMRGAYKNFIHTEHEKTTPIV